MNLAIPNITNIIMYPYVTCTCGRPLGYLYDIFKLLCARNTARTPDAPIGPILDQLGITKQCCRQRIMTSTEFKHYYNM
ncbi:MAG: hypothetical protein WC919_07840, partial [Candidatus Paceibacterota bacterium]